MKKLGLSSKQVPGTTGKGITITWHDLSRLRGNFPQTNGLNGLNGGSLITAALSDSTVSNPNGLNALGADTVCTVSQANGLPEEPRQQCPPTVSTVYTVCADDYSESREGPEEPAWLHECEPPYTDEDIPPALRSGNAADGYPGKVVEI